MTLNEAIEAYIAEHYDTSILWAQDKDNVVRDFMAGVQYAIDEIRKEIEKHDCPEHGYFCDQLYDYLDGLKIKDKEGSK